MGRVPAASRILPSDPRGIPMAKKPLATVVPLSSLTSDPRNARFHGDRNREAVRGSLEAFGPGRSIVVDGSNVVRAGNATLEEATRLGFTDALMVEPGPAQIVVVKRTDWTPAQAIGYGLADNRTAELATWDTEVLAGSLADLKVEGFPIESLGWTDFELDPLLAADWTPPAVGNLPGHTDQQEQHHDPAAHAVHFTPESWAVVEEAIGRFRGDDDYSDSQAIELVCARYLADKR